MTKSSLIQHQHSLQPLEQDVVAPSLIPDENASLDPNDVIKVLVSILDGLCANVMSKDIVYLAIFAAQKQCQKMNISDEVFTQVVERFTKFWKKKSASNPMSSMF